MKRLKKLFVLSLLSVTAVFTAGFSDANAAAKLTPEHLYSWAKENDTARLNKYKHYINIENQDKNTALCLAQQNKDRDAYALLLKFGASTKVPCHDDNDPVCAIIVGEKVKVSPAGLALIGVGAAAGAYALLHDDDKGCDKSKYPLDECPEHGQCSHCKGKNRLESCDEFWTPNADKTACIPVDCPTGEQTACEDKADHITTATPTANKSGDQQCYQCSYTCNEKDKRYDNLGFCAAYHPGIVCELNENQCWYPAKCDTSKGYYDNDDECRNSNPGYTCKTVTNGCYIKDVCDIANGHHPNQASCENANIGYHCTQQENLCWLPNFTLLTECLPNSHTALCETQTGIISTPTPVSKSGPDDCLECDYKCDTASGWQQGSAAANCRAGRVCKDVAINDTNRNKTLICYRDDGCPTNFTYYTTLAACEAGGYVCTESAPGSECWKHDRNAECPDTHPSRNQCQTGTGFTNGQTETPVGDAPCYNCDYQCDTANGWQTTCPAGRKCTDITMPNGKKCYNNTTSACPPDYPYTDLTKCEEGGYVCTESAPGSKCWKHDRNADCPASHPNRTQCQTGTGYTNGQTETQVGDAPCYNCNYQCDTAHSWFATCPAGKTCSEITMPSGAKCYTPTGCDTTHGYFDNTTACQNANPEHVCTIDATGCYVVGVCDAAHGYYATDTACTAANPSYTCVKTAHNCYVKDDPAGCPTPSHINECLTVDGIKTTPSVVAKSGEDDCYDCTYLCDTANGWQSGTASNCPTGWLCKYASLTDPYRSKGADCYKKDKCDPTQGYYDNNSACTTANSEYTCIVDVTGCYTKNICNTTKGYYATKALCEQAAENIGYQCAQSAGGCWKKNAAPTPCTPPSNTAQCLVDSTNAILTTPTVTGQSGTSDCYDCDYQCNTTAGWKPGSKDANCPAGKDCSEAGLSDPYRNKSITCYHDDGCPAGYTATTKAACESGGFTCSESAPGSGCWKQTGDQDCPDDYQETPCTDAKTGITLVPHTPITVGSKLCYKCEYECNNALAYKDDSTLTVCGTTADNGWKFINPVDQGSASCAQCEKKPCPTGTSTTVNGCNAEAPLTAQLGASSTSYNGNDRCYTCNYSCDEDNDYYADKDQCEDGGTRTCTRVDKTVNSRTYTCWKREGVFRCPEGEQKDHCTPSATGFKTSETPKNYEGGTCYVCSYACDTANGWQAGSSCPAGKSCPDGTNKITTPLACIKPICPTTHTYTSKATCQAGGYTCLESATGSGCWMRSGCPSTYPYTSKSACESGGFTCEESTTDTGCWRHKGDQPCPSTHPNETACATPTKSGIKLTQNETTVGSRKCYSCSYGCDTANGWKSSNCPIGTAFTGTCNTEHGATCGKITGCSNTNGYKNTTDIYNCGTSGSNGWKFINSQTKDGTTCAQCEKLPCDDGSATTAGNCEPHTSLKADLGSSSTGYNGDTKCYTCNYSCDEDNGFYTDESECTSSGSYECHKVTYLTGHSCWERGDPQCPSSHPYESPCTSAPNGTTLSQGGPVPVGSKQCYSCSYACNGSTHFTTQSACEANSSNAGYTCSSTSITTPVDTKTCWVKSSTTKPCPTNSHTAQCSKNDNITTTPTNEGKSGTQTCYSCQYSCNSGWTEGTCRAGRDCTEASINDTYRNITLSCYKDNGCPSTHPYTSESSCTSGGYTCTESATGSGCWQRGNPTECPQNSDTSYDNDYCINHVPLFLKLPISRGTGIYVNGLECRKCESSCDDNANAYESNDGCGTKYDCSEQHSSLFNVTCYIKTPKDCPTGTATDVNKCETQTGFTVSLGTASGNYSGETPCLNCTYACDTANGYKSTTDLKNCGTSGSNGWKFINSQTQDGTSCAQCEKLPCPTGSATTAGNCPDSYASLVANIGTSAVGYNGDTKCYTCNYSCDEDNGYYASEAQCTDGGSFSCTSVTERTGNTCWKRGDHQCADDEYQSICPSAGTGYQLSNESEDDYGCYRCFWDCATGWAEGSCPTGYTCSTHITTPYTNQITCYKVDGCDTSKDYYATESDCAKGGYTCEKVEESGYATCYHRTGSQDCPSTHPSETACEEAEGFTSTDITTTVGSKICHKCTWNCALGWTQGAVTPIGFTGTVNFHQNSNVGATSMIGCYKITGCDTASGYKSTTDIKNCGTSGDNGWKFITPYLTKGSYSCAQCEKKLCDTGYTTNVSGCSTYDSLKASLGTSTKGYYGDSPCYECQYACNEDENYYADKGECENGDSYTCTESTENGKTCWHRGGPKVTCNTSCRDDYPYITLTETTQDGKTDSDGNPCVSCGYNCKEEIGYYRSSENCQDKTGTQCVSKIVDYTLNNNEAAHLGCYIQGGDDIPCDDGYSTTYQSVASCGSSGSKGWDFASSGMSGGKVCGKCTAKSCSSGIIGSSTSACPAAEVAGFKATSTTAITDVFSGNNQCYKCNYGCDGEKGFENTLTLDDGWNYVLKTYDGTRCQVRTSCSPCPVGYTKNCYRCNSSTGSGNVCPISQDTIIDEPIITPTAVGDTEIGMSYVYSWTQPNVCAATEYPSVVRCGKCTYSASATSTATGLQNEIYGMRGTSSEPLVNEKENTISLQNLANTTAIGMFSDQSQTVINQGTINIENNIESQNSTAIGIHAGLGVKAINQGLIKIDGKDGTAIGILGEGANHIVNAEDGIIDVTGAKAYGIYVKDGEGALVENKGIIKALGDEAHGIYIEKNANVNTVLNSGSIYVNGTEKGDAGITLNGADLRNEKILAFSGKANLDMLDGRVYLEKGGSIEAEALEGDLTLGVSNVLGSNEDTYAAEGALKADDLANLNLISESALFDAKVTADGHRLERKDFAEFTPNSSIAKYLTSNYEQGKLVEMYDAIKSQTEAQKARQLTAKDLGYDIMPNFADENFMALKSLNRNIADTILKPSDENYRVIAGADSVSLETKNKAVLSGYDLSATSMYTFGDKRLDNKNRLGLGLSFTQLSSSYDRGGSRDLNIVSVFIPYLHKFTEKLNLASILSFGYGYGDLERGGNKKADINDIFYGFTNELRYSIDLNGFASLEPALYLNAIGYTEDGLDEGSSELALATNKTHNLSVEAGIGLFLKKEVSLEKYGKLGFKVGGAYYRELGSPYDDIRTRVKGSNGWYSINDYANIYTHDRALLEAAIDYEYKDLSIYAKFNQIIQKNNPKLFDLGIKYKF